MRGETPQPPTSPAAVWRGAEEADPQIFVASLPDYADGRLHGDWVDAVQAPDEIQADIDVIMDASQITDRTGEWAIHDYEGFGAFELGEYEQLAVVSLVASGIAKHGRAFSHWVNIVGTVDTDRLHKFDEHYRGSWESLAQYAEELLNDMGVEPTELVPSWLRSYVSVDYVALGRDLAIDLETADDPNGAVHVFEPEI